MNYCTALGKHQALQCSFLMTLTLILSHYYRKYLVLKRALYLLAYTDSSDNNLIL